MKRLAGFLVGCTMLAPAFSADGSAARGPMPPPCIDAVVIARDIVFRGTPYQFPNGEQVEFSALGFAVDRVLYGKLTARELTLNAPVPGTTLPPLPRRWLIFLAGSDATGWRYIKRAEGVMRDSRGRDIYAVKWPLRGEHYQDTWLPHDAARFLRRVEYDRFEEYWFCERYQGTMCRYRAPDAAGVKGESVARYGLLLDDMPAVAAELRKEKCIASNAGAPAPSPEHYRLHGDFASLAAVEKRLRTGMTRAEVRALLGDPTYSPTDGQDYYSSEASTRSRHPDLEVTVGLVVDYRKIGGADSSQVTISKQLQSWTLGPIGE